MMSQIIGLFPYFHIYLKSLKKLCTTVCIHYIEKFNILYSLHHGFRHGHSTTMYLINLWDSISTAIDNIEFSQEVFIDITKSFDTVNHFILLYKMKRFWYSCMGWPIIGSVVILVKGISKCTVMGLYLQLE